MFSLVGKLKLLVPFGLALSITMARANFVESFSMAAMMAIGI